MPTPPGMLAIRDTICAYLRDTHTVQDSETIAAQLPPITRHLPDHGLCANDHAPIHRHRQMQLLACHGDRGHTVTYRLSTLDVYSQCQALHQGGYLQRFSGAPVMWLFIEPALASGHRTVERWEAEEFAALAQLACDPGPQR